MKFTLILSDTINGLDVQMVGTHNEVPVSASESMAAAVVAQLAGILQMQSRLGVRITERGGKPSWLV